MGRTPLSVAPPRLVNTMDMLFDPFADGPFKAASRTAVATKSSAGTGTAAVGSGAGWMPNGSESGNAGRTLDRPHLPGADELLEGLNPQQEEAVKHAGGALLIVAGAGSGKTRVLSNRIAYLIATRRAHHGEILAITFTNKAAAEMRERIELLVGGRAKTMWISTFHSSCVRILRREAKNIGLNSNFSIYDSADSLRLITLVAKNLDLDPKTVRAQGHPAQDLRAQERADRRGQLRLERQLQRPLRPGRRRGLQGIYPAPAPGQRHGLR